MMEFLSHISTQRGISYYDGVPQSYIHTERDKLFLFLSVWRYDLGTPS
jgi:hypothetical protein